ARGRAHEPPWWRRRASAGGGRLRPHPRRAGTGAGQPARPCRRAADLRVRLRRRARSRQAPDDGAHRRGARRPGGRHRRQPARRGWRRDRRRNHGRLRRARSGAGGARPRAGHRPRHRPLRRAGRGPGRRQGAWALPGDCRSAASIRRHRGGARRPGCVEPGGGAGMKRTPLSLIAHWAGGELHGQDVAVDAIAHDTRALSSGSLYLALRGERFDGHDFAADALARGAVALLVERLLDLDAPQVLVESSELALARIAAGMQRGRDAKVGAITGSNGKTSVKTPVLSLPRPAGHASANPGNRNNEIGPPLAVIDAPEDADFAIYEMGAGKPGDIAYLTDVARPDVSVVNNIAPAHLERMGDLLGVATTKGAIYTALPAGGTAVVNADDAFGAWFEQQLVRPAETGRRLLRFGLEASAEVTARDVQAGAEGSRFVLVTPQGEAMVELALPGRHNVRNALAAAAIGLACGVPLAAIAEGLAHARPV